MLTVKLELWPGGNEKRAREIGRMYIANDGHASVEDPNRGDYLVGVCRRGTTEVPREIYGVTQPQLEPEEAARFAIEHPKATRAGEVRNYPRLAYNVWRLIARALLATFPEERAPKGTRPILDASVMRGLRWMADHASSTAVEVERAKEWLAAASADEFTINPEQP